MKASWAALIGAEIKAALEDKHIYIYGNIFIFGFDVKKNQYIIDKVRDFYQYFTQINNLINTNK